LQLPLPVLVKVRSPYQQCVQQRLACRSHSAWCCSAKVPAPPVHVPPVAPVTDPFKLIALLFAHTDALAPAFTTGAGVKVITRFADHCIAIAVAGARQVSVSACQQAISPAVGV
jgi:hypothetical protein